MNKENEKKTTTCCNSGKENKDKTTKNCHDKK